MSAKQTYHHRQSHHRRRRRFIKIVLITLLLLLVFGAAIAYDLWKNQSEETSGGSISVIQSFGGEETLLVDEPTFSLQLPSDWQETQRLETSQIKYVTWQATKQKEDNRWLTIYIDKLPKQQNLNRVVAVQPSGDRLSVGSVSSQCQSFTLGGTLDAGEAPGLRPKLTKWENVEFYCNLPRPHENEIGISSPDQIQAVTVNGENQGQHTYFFMYTDHNIHPNYQIFLNALASFHAK